MVENSYLKIISGGQTGTDRAALDAAMYYGVDTGGWCPQGRLAEDGSIPEHYPLRELPGGGYRERTRQNVIDSDASVIIYFGSPAGGTEQTITCCNDTDQPYLLIDAEQLSVEVAAEKIRTFIIGNSPEVMNIAGPRNSEHHDAYTYTKNVIMTVLDSMTRRM